MSVGKIYAFMLEKHTSSRGWHNRDAHKPNDTIDVPVLAFLIQCSDGNILYDTGSSRRLRENLSEYSNRLGHEINISFDGTSDILGCLDKVGVKDLSHLVISHFHFDHAGYADEIIKKYGSQVIFHKDELEAMKNPGKQRGVYFERELMCFDQLSGIGEDTELAYGVWAHHLPGHTPGHIGLLFSDLKLIFCGDSVFVPENLKGHLPDDKMVWDEKKYNMTVESLKEMQEGGKHNIIMSHDPRYLSQPDKFLELFNGKGNIVVKPEENLHYMVVDYL